MRNPKRLIASLLSICIMISTISPYVYAAEIESTETVESTQEVEIVSIDDGWEESVDANEDVDESENDKCEDLQLDNEQTIIEEQVENDITIDESEPAADNEDSAVKESTESNVEDEIVKEPQNEDVDIADDEDNSNVDDEVDSNDTNSETENIDKNDNNIDNDEQDEKDFDDVNIKDTTIDEELEEELENEEISEDQLLDEVETDSDESLDEDLDISMMLLPGERSSFFNTDNIVLEAGIYTDAYRTNLELELTKEGSTLDAWGLDTTKYIGIDLGGLVVQDGTQYNLVVEMNPAIYLDQNVDPSLENTVVTWTKNSNLPANGLEDSYPVKKYSLKEINYLLDQGATGLSLGLPIRYDYSIWNRKAGDKLGYGDSPLLKIYLEMITDDETTQIDSCERILTTAIASESHTTGYSSYERKGTTDIGGLKQSIDSELNFYINQMSNIDYSDSFYYEDLKYTITVPKYTDSNGLVHYMTPTKVNFPNANGTADYVAEISEDGDKIIYTFDKTYYKSKWMIAQYFKFPSTAANLPDGATFKGNLKIESEGLSIVSRDFKFLLSNSEKADILFSTTTGLASVQDRDVVQFLGTLGLYNATATDNQSNITVQYDFDTTNTNHIQVTTILLPSDTVQQYVDVKYTLIDENGDMLLDESGEPEIFSISLKNGNYKATSQKNKYIQFGRYMLPESHQGYFFKSIEYNIDKVMANAVLYASGSVRGRTSAGTIWGYVNTPTVPKEKVYNKATIKTQEGVEIRNKSITITFNSGGTVAYSLESGSVSATTVTAGNSFDISGKAIVTSYPYSSSQNIDNITLALILPEGVSVNTYNLNVRTANGTKLKVDETVGITREQIGVGKYLWRIPFEKFEKVGYATETLSALPSGASILFTITLNTDIEISTQTIRLEECVFMASQGIKNGASGSYAPSAITDTYDLNMNGSRTDKIGGFKLDEEDVTINKAIAGLSITTSLYENDTPIEKIVIKDEAKTVNYKVDIRCDSGGEASDFFYLIPIPKQGNDGAANFVKTAEQSLKLSGPIEISEVGTKLKVLFTKEDVNYNSAQNESVVWTETVDSYDDVKMIKVIIDSTDNELLIMQNGSRTTLNIPLQLDVSANEFQKSAGSKIEWSSRGYYTYQLGSNVSQGHVSSAIGVVECAYEYPKIEITLTAEKDGNPTNGVKLDSVNIGSYYKSQTFTVSDINSTINLVSKDYDFTQLNQDEKNKTFAILSRLDNSEIEIVEEGKIYDVAKENKNIVLEFEILGANYFSYTQDERYVEFSLVGDNNLTVPVRINIETEISLAEGTSAIVAGKTYVPFASTATSTNISQDSSFTAQFIANNLLPDNYIKQELVFGTKLKSGTTITMIDWSNGQYPEYYNFVTNDGTGNVLDLSSFLNMNDGTNFKRKVGNQPILEQLLFVIDLNNENLFINSITMRRTGADGEIQDEKLMFKPDAKREFNFDLINETVLLTDNKSIIDLSIEYGSQNGSYGSYESEYVDKYLALMIDLTEWSDETTVRYNNQVLRQNAESKVIIPLVKIQNLNNKTQPVKIAIESTKTKEANYEISFWSSATNNGNHVQMGQMLQKIKCTKFDKKDVPSIRIDDMTPRLIKSDDLKEGARLLYEIEKSNDSIVTLELQEEDGYGFKTITDGLNAVNGNVSHEFGKYNITNGDGEIYVNFNTYKITKGTYRFLFTISNDGYKKETTYDFIVY